MSIREQLEVNSARLVPSAYTTPFVYTAALLRFLISLRLSSQEAVMTKLGPYHKFEHVLAFIGRHEPR